MRHRIEYVLAWLIVKFIGLLPRPLARGIAILFSWTVYLLHRRLRTVGMHNLALAFPEKTMGERTRILRGVFTSLGRQLAEVCLFPRYTPHNLGEVVVYDGFENFERALAFGKGVLFLTAHLGAWELSAFAHSLYGYPLHVVMRSLDNPYLDRMLREYRAMHGNSMLDKDDNVRGLLAALKAGETAGVLMDTNMTPPQGVFVDFFGIAACTASGVARIALRTAAAVVPGFTIWDSASQCYRLRFDPALDLIRTGDDESDIVANTQLFTKVIEYYVRRYPDQWLWVHRRWKTRPTGEPPLY
jgi:Kdo2-lipid IVA lauroyltransferase/acyltransferase